MKLVSLPSGTILYRASSLQYLRTAHSPAGARKGGGRFNRRDISAHYLALDPLTAFHEYQQGDPEPQPLAIVAFKVFVADRLLDIRDGARPLGLPWDDWDKDWDLAKRGRVSTCPSWEIGELALKAHASGIIAPSTKHGSGENIILFPELATAGLVKYEVIDPARLIDKYAARL